MLRLFQWIMLFSLLYLALLPLGGYREYRPMIVRRDTILPVLTALFFFYGLSGAFLLYRFQTRIKKGAYLSLLIAVALIFTWADEFRPKRWACERNALELLSVSQEETVVLPKDCPVLSWKIIEDPAHSDLPAKMLYHWGITNRITPFYQQ